MAKVIHVHLIFEKIDRYFGSISAIYGTFSADQIGIQQSTLQHKGLTDGGSKELSSNRHKSSDVSRNSDIPPSLVLSSRTR